MCRLARRLLREDYGLEGDWPCDHDIPAQVGMRIRPPATFRVGPVRRSRTFSGHEQGRLLGHDARKTPCWTIFKSGLHTCRFRAELFGRPDRGTHGAKPHCLPSIQTLPATGEALHAAGAWPAIPSDVWCPGPWQVCEPSWRVCKGASSGWRVRAGTIQTGRVGSLKADIAAVQDVVEAWATDSEDA